MTKYNHESHAACLYTSGVRPLHVPSLKPEGREELDKRSRTPNAPRLRTRAQMVLLSAEHRHQAPQIAITVRKGSLSKSRRWTTSQPYLVYVDELPAFLQRQVCRL
jgi:hypothetical protein